LPQPRYAHLPVVATGAGEKLSKQTGAVPLNCADPVPTLVAALGFLEQSPPPELARASIGEIWSWARQHWRLDRVIIGARNRPARSSVAPDHMRPS
jgi:glutamyl-Q tRNA(Asp) synthetase